MSKGIDVSHNNGVIDWAKVKADGIDFAIIRCGYGQIIDRQFKANITGAEKAGMPVGIYYFSYALNVGQAAQEAAHCLSLIKPHKIDLPVYFDFEYDSEIFGKKKGVTYTKSLRTAIHAAFCDNIKAAGYTPGIYTNVDYITNRLNWSKLSGNVLWLAQWPLGASRNIEWREVRETTVSVKYGKPAIWQIGKGRVDGIKTDTDYNYGYTPLPDKRPQPPVVTVAPFKPRDRVTVQNTVKQGGVTRGKLYGGAGLFVVYRDVYDVIGVRGNRVVIGVGKAVTAAVDAGDLKLV